jgi:hypothetical protein
MEVIIMFGEMAAVLSLAGAACKVAEIATGEAQRKRDEAMERAVEKHFNSIEDNTTENNEEQ